MGQIDREMRLWKGLLSTQGSLQLPSAPITAASALRIAYFRGRRFQVYQRHQIHSLTRKADEGVNYWQRQLPDVSDT
jgi:hypothetical protein